MKLISRFARMHWMRSLAPRAVLLLAAGLIVAGSATTLAQPTANGTSSPIGICGRYSVSFSGILVNGQGYFAGVGEYTTDCYGNLSGVETENFNGKVCQYTATGTYKLRRNGTGTVSVTIVPVTPADACETATHTEAIAVGSKGRIVKAIGIGSTAVTINEEWVRQ
jgi:hypothetical protein